MLQMEKKDKDKYFRGNRKKESAIQGIDHFQEPTQQGVGPYSK